jgi:hypothetical protein
VSCARSNRAPGTRREEAGSPCSAGITETRRRLSVTPARDFAGLAALFGEGAEGKSRGGGGLLIGVGYRRNGRIIRHIDEGEVTAGGARLLARNPDRGGRWV